MNPPAVLDSTHEIRVAVRSKGVLKRGCPEDNAALIDVAPLEVISAATEGEVPNLELKSLGTPTSGGRRKGLLCDRDVRLLHDKMISVKRGKPRVTTYLSRTNRSRTLSLPCSLNNRWCLVVIEFASSVVKSVLLRLGGSRDSCGHAYVSEGYPIPRMEQNPYPLQ
jgi:hypothetical protein